MASRSNRIHGVDDVVRDGRGVGAYTEVASLVSKTDIRISAYCCCALLLCVLVGGLVLPACSSCDPVERPAVVSMIPAGAGMAIIVPVLQPALAGMGSFMRTVTGAEGAQEVERLHQSLKVQYGFDPFAPGDLKRIGIDLGGAAALFSFDARGEMACWLPLADAGTFRAEVGRLVKEARGADASREMVISGQRFVVYGFEVAESKVTAGGGFDPLLFMRIHHGYAFISPHKAAAASVADILAGTDGVSLDQLPAWRELMTRVAPRGLAWVYTGQQPVPGNDNEDFTRGDNFTRGGLFDVSLPDHGIEARGHFLVSDQWRTTIQRLFSSGALKDGLALVPSGAVLWSVLAVAPTALPEVVRTSRSLRQLWQRLTRDFKAFMALDLEQDVLGELVPPVVAAAHVGNLALVDNLQITPLKIPGVVEQPGASPVDPDSHQILTDTGKLLLDCTRWRR